MFYCPFSSLTLQFLNQWKSIEKEHQTKRLSGLNRRKTSCLFFPFLRYKSSALTHLTVRQNCDWVPLLHPGPSCFATQRNLSVFPGLFLSSFSSPLPSLLNSQHLPGYQPQWPRTHWEECLMEVKGISVLYNAKNKRKMARSAWMAPDSWQSPIFPFVFRFSVQNYLISKIWGDFKNSGGGGGASPLVDLYPLQFPLQIFSLYSKGTQQWNSGEIGDLEQCAMTPIWNTIAYLLT